MKVRVLFSLFIGSILAGCASGGYAPVYIISDSVKEEVPAVECNQDAR